MVDPRTAATEPAPTPPATVPKNNVWMLLVVVIAALLAGGAGAAFFATQMSPDARAGDATEKKGEDKPRLPAQFVKLDPPFVVNFEAKGLMRFLQVTIEVMTRDPQTLDLIKKNDPMSRNDLIMLFSNQRYEVISTREGKEQLREEALQVVAKVIAAEGGKDGQVAQLYFTSFVLQ